MISPKKEIVTKQEEIQQTETDQPQTRRVVPLVQGQVLGLLLTDESYCSDYIDELQSNMFEKIYSSIFDSIKEYWQKYNKTIPTELLTKELMFREGVGLTEGKIKVMKDAVANCVIDPRATEYSKEAMEDYIRREGLHNNLSHPVKNFKRLRDEPDFLAKMGEYSNNLAEAVQPLSKAKGKRPAQLISYDPSEFRQMEWLWEGWLPKGKLALLAGHAGDGKTTIACNMAAVISRGGQWWDGTWCERPGKVLIWSAEDDVKYTLGPRLHAANADHENIQFICGAVKKGKTRDSDPFPYFDPSQDMESLGE